MRTARQAAVWAEARETFSPVNNCLRAVLMAYDVLGQIAPLARAEATATEAWDLAEDRHLRDFNPPRGALVCFPNWGAGKSGHIAIGLGGDRVRSTGIDSSWYFTGTIAEVAEACGNRYAGWVGDFAGRRIDFAGMAGGSGTEAEDDMQLTDPVTPNTGGGDVNAYLFYTRQDAAKAVAQLTALTAAVSSLATAKGLDPAALGDLVASRVDAALKDDFASLTAKITQNADTLTTAELQAIGKTVGDVLSNRLAS